MNTFKFLKGNAKLHIVLNMIIVNIFILVLLNFVNTYTFTNLGRIVLIGFNLYQIYYLLLSLTLNLKFEDNAINITGIWGLKNIIIPLENIKYYFKTNKCTRFIKLSGVGKSNYSIGRSVVDTIGTTYLFLTSMNENMIFLITDDENMNYALSLIGLDEFEKALNDSGINMANPISKRRTKSHIHKDKKFIIPFIVTSIIIIVLTVMPFIMYLKGKIPNDMPLTFDSKFVPLKWGTGKQFAFKQMTYGVLNMAILFCMYYATYFHAKYDKKSAYRYIYIAGAVALLFLIMQIRILINFR